MNAAITTCVHLSIVQPPGYVHSMALLDAALYFRHQFRRLGVEVSVAKNRLRRHMPNLIFGAHLGFDPALLQIFPCCFVNLEQLSAGGCTLSAAYLDLLHQAAARAAVIDYDPANPPAYADQPAAVPLICFGYAPYLEELARELPLAQRPLDLLFFGSMNPRRQALIDQIERAGRTVVCFDAPVYGPERDAYIRQARAVLNCHHYDSAVFEQVRAFQVLSLGTPLVSERTARTCPPPVFEHAVHWFDATDLAVFFSDDYPRTQFVEAFAQQRAAFRRFDPLDRYATALAYACAACATAQQRLPTAAASPPQRLLHLGSGKDYRPGWLNVDVLASAQPDIRLDLSRPLRWPLALSSPVWGRVQLQAGASDLIYANNVLEHVSDLPMLMRNCLDLLRLGGQMIIEVPYEASLGAWQDPTHVRAMNEKSWLYYTDWFWYLGWMEHRFCIREFQWLDDALQGSDRATAAFMRVTLEKIPTTTAERMTARTLRPDFGGLIEALTVDAGVADEPA